MDRKKSAEERRVRHLPRRKGAPLGQRGINRQDETASRQSELFPRSVLSSPPNGLRPGKAAIIRYISKRVNWHGAVVKM